MSGSPDLVEREISPAEKMLNEHCAHHVNDEIIKNIDKIRHTLVNRKASNGAVVMYSQKLHGILKPGQPFCLATLTECQACDANEVFSSDMSGVSATAAINDGTATCEGQWRSDLIAKTSSDANVFGKSGTFLTQSCCGIGPGSGSGAGPGSGNSSMNSRGAQCLSIPVSDALYLGEEKLREFGATLVKNEDIITLPDNGHFEQLYLVEYVFSEKYISTYVFNQRKGGGLFVETHDFPHIFMPLSEHCSGGLILGKREGTKLTLIGIQIPFGYALLVDSNVIHGDSFFKGPYAIALTEELMADTVIFKRPLPNGELDIQPIDEYSCHCPLLPAYQQHEKNGAGTGGLIVKNKQQLSRPSI